MISLHLFRSNGQSEIYYDSENAIWILKSHTPPFPFFMMKRALLSKGPFGRNSWTTKPQKDISDSKGVNVCGFTNYTTIILTLSTCHPGKFTCDDGECIALR